MYVLHMYIMLSACCLASKLWRLLNPVAPRTPIATPCQRCTYAAVMLFAACALILALCCLTLLSVTTYIRKLLPLPAMKMHKKKRKVSCFYCSTLVSPLRLCWFHPWWPCEQTFFCCEYLWWLFISWFICFCRCVYVLNRKRT